MKSHVEEKNFAEATHGERTRPKQVPEIKAFSALKKNTSPQFSGKSSASATAFLHPCFGAALGFSACFPSILRVLWM